MQTLTAITMGVDFGFSQVVNGVWVSAWGVKGGDGRERPVPSLP